MTDSPHLPSNAISLARISDVRPDPRTGRRTSEGVDHQVHNHRLWAKRNGWKLGHVEKSMRTAYGTKLVAIHPDGREDHRVWRPDLQKCLAMLWRREYDGLLVTDLDRYARDPYDLEDLITLVVQARKRGWPLRIASLTGSLKLDTDADITMARMMMTIAAKSSADTARRVSEARTRLALAGKHGGGPRPYGFGMPLLDHRGKPVLDPATGKEKLDYLALVPEEAAVIAAACKALLAGISMKAIVRDLNERGVPTATGKGLWLPDVLAEMLLRPRNAGKIVDKGDVIGEWPGDPIVPEETWRAVVAKLKDPKRITTTGPEPKWLGSNIYRCGKPGCEWPMYVQSSSQVTPKYCHRARAVGTGHAARQVGPVDEYVETVLLERLLRPDAVDLLRAAPTPDVDLNALRARRALLRKNRKEATVDKNLGLIDRGEWLASLEAIDAEVDRITSRLDVDAESEGDDLLRPLINAEDFEAAYALWKSWPLAARRGVLKRVLVVTILPVGNRQGPRIPVRESVLIEAAE